MKNILVIGATGQIGSELTLELRKRYGNTHVVAGYIQGAEPKGELKESGPTEIVDVTDQEVIEAVVKKYQIDTIYNLAALLSVVAESKPKLAWKIGVDGLWNVLEVARMHGCAVFTPSSIGSFGTDTPHTQTPQDTIQRPRTMYGISKVTTELLSDYYYTKYKDSINGFKINLKNEKYILQDYLSKETIKALYPNEFYKIKGKTAFPIKGIYLNELFNFRLKSMFKDLQK